MRVAGAKVRDTILLTGATGRIGPYVLDDLLQAGFNVRVATPDPVRESDHVTWVKTDFTDNVDYGQLVSGIVGVVHLAAELWNPATMMQVNVRATEALAQAAETYNVNAFIYASSITVYGYPTTSCITETTPTLTLEGDSNEPYLHEPFMKEYALTKLAGEFVIKKNIKRTKAVSLRFSNVTSEADVEKILREWPLGTRIWRGYRRTHQVYVKDVAAAVLFMLQGILSGKVCNGVNYDVFNVGEDEEESNRFFDLFRRYGHAMGCRFCACPFVVPAFLDFLKDRIKYRTISRALSAGAVQYSSQKLLGMGYKYQYGIRAIQDRVIDSLVKNAR